MTKFTDNEKSIVANYVILAAATREACGGDAVEAAHRLGGAIVCLLGSQHDDAMRTIGEALVTASMRVGVAEE